MVGLVEAIACGTLSALTWAGLVWMSPNYPVRQFQAWGQGFLIVAIANLLIWVAMASLRFPIVIWVIGFWFVNALVGKLVLPYLRDIQIPDLWALLIHPVAIAAMNILLGGALGAL